MKSFVVPVALFGLALATPVPAEGDVNPPTEKQCNDYWQEQNDPLAFFVNPDQGDACWKAGYTDSSRYNLSRDEILDCIATEDPQLQVPSTCQGATEKCGNGRMKAACIEQYFQDEAQKKADRIKKYEEKQAAKAAENDKLKPVMVQAKEDCKAANIHDHQYPAEGNLDPGCEKFAQRCAENTLSEEFPGTPTERCNAAIEKAKGDNIFFANNTS